MTFASGTSSGATTVVSMSRARSADAASRPMKLAPTTTARRAPFAAWTMPRASSSVRRTCTRPSPSAPGTGSGTAFAPVASTSFAYGTRSPPAS